MRKQTRQMEIEDPLAFEEEKAFHGEVREAVQDESLSAPEPSWDFNPIRTGGLRVLSLRLVDRFGRPKDLDCRRVATTSHRIIADAPELIRLPPRLVQPARLNLRWLAADGDGEQEMNDHPASSPICGWLLPNNLDGSLMVYDSGGTPLGFLDEDAHWQPMPGAAAPPVGEIVNPYLRRMVAYLKTRGSDFLGHFLLALEDALEHIDPEGFARHPELALLMGRPIALARVAIGLELKGRPAVHQGWNHFRMDLRRPVRDTDDFTRVDLPIRLGEFSRFNDGLVGYWIEAREGIERSPFYSPQAERGGGTGIVTHADDPSPLDLTIEDPPLGLSVLLDPRGTIHATSGILPTKSIGIPPDQYAAALKKIEVVFLTAPVVTGVGSIDIPLPDEPGYAWSWATDPKVPLRPIDPMSIFAREQEIREGWLRLSPVSEPGPGPRRALNPAPTRQGGRVDSPIHGSPKMSERGQQTDEGPMGATNPNLLCHMKFEAIKAGKVPDASGRGHDATVVGSPKIVPDARFGSCIELQGMSDCLNLMPACIPAEGAYTISFWARGMDDMPHMCCFLDTRDAAGTTPLKIELPGHDVAAATRPPATGSRPAEEWTHWAFVRKNTGGETLVYRDAVLWKTLPAQSPQPPPTGPVTAARFGGMVDAQQHHKGRFAGLRIYNTAQEPDEIADDMQEDQTAVASFRKSYPIDFALHNDEDERVLYITEDTTGHPMHLEVTNASGRT